MRDPNRIDRFCDELKSVWHCVPDLRFGQLIINLLDAYKQETGWDFFYKEDDDLMEFFIRYISENTGYVRAD